MRIVTLIQARMSSTRLPGKVLADIGGKTMLARVYERSARARLPALTVIATSSNGEDDPVEEHAERLGAPIFRGSEDDVLDRFHGAALHYEADSIVRITSDSPLMDPAVIDEACQLYTQKTPDYAVNENPPVDFRGEDVEVVSFNALERAWREAAAPYERVHVTPYFYTNPHLFSIERVPWRVEVNGHRWTVDTEDDLAFVRAVYSHFECKDTFSWLEVLQLLEGRPELRAMNQGVRQKPLEDG